MTELRPSSVVSVAVFIVVFASWAIAFVVGRFSPKWSQRIGCFGLIAMVQGSIMVLMLWAKEP